MFGFYENNDYSDKIEKIENDQSNRYREKILYIKLEKIPRTSLGKIDYNKLNITCKELC